MFSLEEESYFKRHESCFQILEEMSDNDRDWDYVSSLQQTKTDELKKREFTADIIPGDHIFW